MNRIAVKMALAAFFALALVGWVSGLGVLTCSIRAASGAAVVFLLTRMAIRVVIGILARAIAQPPRPKGRNGNP